MAAFTYLSALLLLISSPDIKALHSEAVDIAESYQIDADVFRSLVFLESSWDAKANNGQCYGLGQLKPSTASEVAGHKITGEDLIDDPILALELSACYLASCIEKANGDVMLGLSYYRYGPWSGTKRDTQYSHAVIKIYRECYSQEPINSLSGEDNERRIHRDH